jgi:quercetin dioxygenase-like cupin family protein
LSGLHIIRASEGETVERTGAPIFEGTVHGRTFADSSNSSHLAAALVHFAANARTRMHRHTSDQLLIVTNGIGRVGDASGDHVIATGDAVIIPAGHDHWHGAGDSGSPMTHLTVQAAGSETTVL